MRSGPFYLLVAHNHELSLSSTHGMAPESTQQDDTPLWNLQKVVSNSTPGPLEHAR